MYNDKKPDNTLLDELNRLTFLASKAIIGLIGLKRFKAVIQHMIVAVYYAVGLSIYLLYGIFFNTKYHEQLANACNVIALPIVYIGCLLLQPYTTIVTIFALIFGEDKVLPPPHERTHALCS